MRHNKETPTDLIQATKAVDNSELLQVVQIGHVRRFQLAPLP